MPLCEPRCSLAPSARWRRPRSPPPPVAIVEDVGEGLLGIEPMDYLNAGRKIDLGADTTIVISFFSSCAREKVTGGHVVIADGHSDVTGGAVERTMLKCDADKMLLSQRQGEQTAGVVERGITIGGSNLPTVYGASPVLVAPGGRPIKIERLGDHSGGEVLPAQRAGGRLIYDYARAGRELVAGATYRATAGDRKVLFRVDPAAEPGATPLLGRLVLIASP